MCCPPWSHGPTGVSPAQGPSWRADAGGTGALHPVWSVRQPAMGNAFQIDLGALVPTMNWEQGHLAWAWSGCARNAGPSTISVSPR